MLFKHPLFLWALTFLAIPIIIHLFNFRKYKKIYFTNVKFLKELQIESKSKSKLKEILILLARCLTIFCLVIAFSQPVFLKNNQSISNASKKGISLYIDNSFSMNNENKQGLMIETAKNRAKDVLKAYGISDKFQIISNDFEGKHQRFYSKEEAIIVIDEIKSSSTFRLLSDVLKRQLDFFNKYNFARKQIYIFSDLQKSTFNIEQVKADSTVDVTIIPIKANQVNNLYVDTCWFESPIQQKGLLQKLHVGIVNNGIKNIEIGSAKLIINRQQVAISSFSINADSKKEIQFTFENKTNGFNYGSVKIEDYPITFDDELFFSFNSKLNVSVSLINGKDQSPINSFNSLFTSDSLFNYKSFSEKTIDYSFFNTSDVIVLNQLSEISSGLISEIQKFTQKGGALVMIPSKNSNILTYNNALNVFKMPLLSDLDSSTLKIDKIDVSSKFYSGVFEKIEDRINLPIIQKHFRLLKSNKNDYETILKLQNNDELLGCTQINNAVFFMFSAPLSESCGNFSKHTLFVPTFYQICFKSLKSPLLFYPVSSNVMIKLKNDMSLINQAVHIKSNNGEDDIIPQTRIINNNLVVTTQSQINKAGFYEIKREASILLPLAFNFLRSESDLKCYDKNDISKLIVEKKLTTFNLIEDTGADISSQILDVAEGKKLWKLFIILSLLFICIEVTLLKVLK